MFIAIPLVFCPKIYEGAFLPKLLTFQALLIPLALLALWQGKWPQMPNAFLLSIACYLLICTLSVTQATNTIEATFNLSHHLGLIAVALLIFATLSAFHLTQIIQVAAWASLPVAGIGLIQYLGLPVPYIDHIPSNTQPSATFYHRNAAAAYLICVIPLAWIGLQNASTKRAELSWTLLLSIQGIFLVFTRTRAAWVALAGTGIALYLVTKWLTASTKHQRQTIKSRLLVSAICLVLLTALLPENIQGTRRQKFDEKKTDAVTAVKSMFTPEGTRGRFALWQHTFTMVAKNPLGVGAGNWQFIYPSYAQGEHINVMAAPERPHNDLLWIAAELGLVGLLAFIAIIANAAVLATTLIAHADQRIRTQTLGLCAIVLAYLIDGLFSFPHGQITPTLYFWFALGGITLLYALTFGHRITNVRSIWAIGTLVFIINLGITRQRVRYDIHHLRVHAAERKQDWDTVVNEAAKASAIGTYRANTFIALGRALYRSGQLEPALKAYETGLRLHPNSLNAHNNIGIVQRRLGNPEKAISSFQAAISLYPGFIEAHYNLGLTYFDLKQYKEAQTMYQKVISWGLNTPHVYYGLGRIYHIHGDLIQAQNHYLLALRHDANFAPAQKALAQLGVSQ